MLKQGQNIHLEVTNSELLKETIKQHKNVDVQPTSIQVAPQ